MTIVERNAIEALEVRLFGEDGEKGAIGTIRVDVKAMRSDLDQLKGAMRLAVAAMSFLGFAGGLWIFQAAVQAVNAAH